MNQNPRTRARTQTALAVATTLAIAAGLTAATTVSATAAPAAPTATDEVVVPNPGRFQPRGEELGQAGDTGYAHRREGGGGWAWRDTGTGAETAITEEQAKGHSGLYATVDEDPEITLDRVTVKEVATGQERLRLTLPGNRRFAGAYTTDTVVTTGGADQAQYGSFQLQQVKDGKTTEVPVTGLLGTFDELSVVRQDAHGAFIRVWQEGHLFEQDYLLDYATATLKGTAMTGEGVVVSLGAERIAYYDVVNNRAFTAPRATPAATTETQVPALQDTWEPVVTAVGDWLLVTERASDRTATTGGNPLRAVRLDTGQVEELLPHAEAQLATAPDGSVLAVGGTGADAWAVRRVTVGENGVPTLATVADVPAYPAHFAGIALGGGRLSYLSTDLPGIDAVGLHDVDTDLAATPPTAGAPKLRTRLIAPSSPGLVSLGDGDSVYSDGKRLYARTDGTTSRTADLPVANATVIDGAGRYVLAEHGTTKYVADLENGNPDRPDVLLTLTDSAAALWHDKVWKPADTPGHVNTYDLDELRTVGDVDLGSGCRPTELQAVSRWLYWACGADKAGVYDIDQKKSVPVPAGEALLGDGFVVRHEGDKLKLTAAASGATRDFADLPAGMGSGRRSTWTVDKFGGGIAYLDAEKNIHVKRSGATPQSLGAVTHSIGPVTFQGAGVEPGPATWSPVFRFSKPVGSWELRIAKGNGEGVRSLTGTRGTGAAARPQWDGKDARGRAVESGQYRWELVARPLDGVGPSQSFWGAFGVTGSSLTTLPGTYSPVTPARLLDTRSGLGAPKAKVGPGGTVRLKVAGQAGAPAEGLTAVVLNVTATNATKASFVSVYPYETQRTSASNLNFTAGRTAANLVTVPVVNGWVELYNKNGSVDLLADIAGYYTEGTAGSAYQPVTPTRLLDTRTGTGAPKAKVAAGGTVTLAVTEPGVTAVAMNVTATNATAAGFVSVYPYGTARPDVSSLNFAAGQTVPNLVIVPVKDGKVTFYNRAGTVDLLADVAGYFKPGAGSVFTGMQPKRLMDTRDGTGVPKAKVGPGKTVSLTVGTKYKAVVLNVTATNPTEGSFVSVYPYGTARTSASSLNFSTGQTVPNLVIVPVKDGKVTFYNKNGSVDLIADVTGYYTD
ncbi:hypothetical protein ACIGEZ_26630 [Streptomyces sp. NPDC085481]|uniref:hypothetical protein n=1 Tax=Streptomyces sp. NPDC085481 TaxID=3365727 RepID=UPI0037CE65A1